MSRPTFVALALAALVLIAFAGAGRNGFVLLDDPAFVVENPIVARGLTLEGLGWALTTGHEGNWMPVTWLAHMVDVELFGLRPAGHHWVSVLLHLGNTLLVFSILRAATGTLWRSALVAALFGLHPLHVESVAWIAERKDVLSTCLALAAVRAWIAHVGGRARAYALSIALYALALAAKPMPVTLPFVLLLLDAWPLERSSTRTWRELVREKVPFFALALLSCCVTFAVQDAGGAVRSEAIPLAVRGANAVVAYATYLRNALWPADLACFYPHPWSVTSAGPPTWMVLASAGTLVALTVLVLVSRRRYALVGWLGFLGTLLPVIGLVQVGDQALADRYTYVPLLGPFVILVWGGGELCGRLGSTRIARTLAGLVAIVGLAALVVRTRAQVAVWRDDETLFRHAAAVTERNWLAHDALATSLKRAGRIDAAAAHWETVLDLRPDLYPTLFALGRLELERGRLERARGLYERAVAVEPDVAAGWVNLGAVQEREGDWERALASYQRAFALDPTLDLARENVRRAEARIAAPQSDASELLGTSGQAGGASAHAGLGAEAVRAGRDADAVRHFRAALEAEPARADVRASLGLVLERLGREREAVAELRRAIEDGSREAVVGARLGWILATSPDAALRDGAEALRWAESTARAVGHDDPTALEVLAAAHAEVGDFAQARRWQAAALEHMPAARRAEAAERLELYRADEPFRRRRPTR